MELSLSTVAVLGIILFLLLMFLKMPIGVAMLLSAFVGIWLIRGLPAALSTSGLALFRTASTYNLSVIPLFIFMGILATAGGVSRVTVIHPAEVTSTPTTSCTCAGQGASPSCVCPN